MLSEVFKQEIGLGAAEFQIILEICLDREGFDDIAYKLTGLPYRQFNKSGFVNLYYNYLQVNYGLNGDDMKNLKRRIFEYTLEKTRDSLIPEVIKTEFIRRMLAKNLGGKLKASGIRVTEELMDFVIQSFSTYVGRYSKDKFELISGDVKQFIQHCFAFYFQANYADITRYASQQSTVIRTGEGEESIYDLDIGLSVEQHLKRKLVNFKRLTNNILTASELLFNHKGVVFYDLWTRVKDKLAVERYEESKRCIRKNLNYSLSSRILMSEPYSRESADNESYRTGIFNARQKLLEVFEAKYNKLFTPKIYKSIFLTLKEINDREPDANNKRFFKGTTSKKSMVSDSDKFLALVYAFAAISELLEYLELENIDPLTVPSTIFRKRKYLNKFNSFEEYLKLHDVVVDLNNNQGELEKGVPSNDTISEYLYREQIEGLSKLKLIDIRKVLDGEIEKPEKPVLLYPGEREFLNKMFLFSSRLYKYYGDCLNVCMQICKLIQEKTDIVIFNSSNYDINTAKRWLVADKRLAKFATNEKILKIYNYDKELLELLPKDENMLYNTIRYCSLSMAITHVLGTLCNQLLKSNNRLDLLDVISNNEAYIDLPQMISGPIDISFLLREEKVILCKQNNFEDGTDTFISTIYNQIIKKYQSALVLVRRIRGREYNTLKVNGVQSSSVYERYKDKLNEIARSMLSTYANIGINNAKFIRTLMSCTKDEGDYLLYNNCPVTTIKYKSQYFLHSLGYWISPQVDGELSIIKITEDETFI